MPAHTIQHYVTKQTTSQNAGALLPCQQNGGNRCARRRSPRSPPTVDAEGKRSLDVKGNALFRHSTLPLMHVLVASGAHESL
jgi:hypothetical protein